MGQRDRGAGLQPARMDPSRQVDMRRRWSLLQAQPRVVSLREGEVEPLPIRPLCARLLSTHCCRITAPPRDPPVQAAITSGLVSAVLKEEAPGTSNRRYV